MAIGACAALHSNSFLRKTSARARSQWAVKLLLAGLVATATHQPLGADRMPVIGYRRRNGTWEFQSYAAAFRVRDVRPLECL